MVEEKLIDRGMGEWLILSYLPVSLFSLRMTHATNKGGKTLLVPTPYAFKMTLIDACFRVFDGNNAEIKARQVFDLIKNCEIKFSPPAGCIVQNTFTKVLDLFQSKKSGAEKEKEILEAKANRNYPFRRTIAYREFCFYSNGELKVAIGVNGLSEDVVSLIRRVGSHINCIGKRGSFWQYIGDSIYKGNLPEGYTFPQPEERLMNGKFQWVQYLDDFGEVLCKAKDGFDRISTYGSGTIKLGEHRILVKTVIPYGFVQSSKHFTQYKKII